MMSDRQKTEAPPESGAQKKHLDPFSQAVHMKKEQWYSKVRLSKRQLDVVICIVSVLLGTVVLLIILEAAGIFKL